MPLTTSLYLEALRALAAFAVFFLHISFQGFTGGFFWQLGIFGNDAVMAFFVLSGFVIAFSADHKHPSLAHYLVARLGRLWSIVIPAILLTFILENIVRYFFDQSLSFNRPPDTTIRQFLSSLFFVNQIWFLTDTPGLNPPFWSLGYEFIYYVFFGFAFYFQGWKRLFLMGTVVAIAGPKIVIFMPIWLLGAVAYHLTKLRFRPAIGWTAWLGSLMALIFYYGLDIKTIINLAAPSIEPFSNGVWTTKELATHYTFALIVFFNIFGFNIIGANFSNAVTKFEPLIKGLAYYSFSLYLYHYPLLFFFRSFSASLAEDPSNSIGQWWQIGIMYIGTLSCCYILGRFTEPRKKEITVWLSTLVAGRSRNIDATIPAK